MVDVPVRIAESGPLAESSGGSGTVTFSRQWGTSSSLLIDNGVTVFGEVWDTGTSWQSDPPLRDAISFFAAAMEASGEDKQIFVGLQYLGVDNQWHFADNVTVPNGSPSQAHQSYIVGAFFPEPASPLRLRLAAQYGGTPCSLSGLNVGVTLYKGTGILLP